MKHKSKFRPKRVRPVKKKVVNRIPKEQYAAIRKRFHKIIWKPVKAGLAILRGNFSQSDIRFTPSIRDNQGSANAIIAPVYSGFRKSSKWSAADLNRILYYGKDLYCKTIVLNKLKIGSTFPPNFVYPTFYVGFNKVTIFIDNNVINGEILRGKEDLAKNFIDKLSGLLKNNNAVIICLGVKVEKIRMKLEKLMPLKLPENKPKPKAEKPQSAKPDMRCIYFSVWGKDNDIFCFCPHDGNAKGGLIHVNCGTSFVLRMKGLAVLKDYILETHSGPYSLYSVKVLQKKKIESAISKVMRKKPVKEVIEEDEPVYVEPPVVQEATKEDTKKKKPTAAAAAAAKAPKPTVDKPILVEQLKAPADPTPVLSLDYNEISTERGILTAKTYVKDPNLIFHTLIAAAVIHSLCRASKWTKETMSDILKLGKALLEQSSSVRDSEDWLETVKLPLEYNKVKYRIDFEKIIFGEVASPGDNNMILGFKQGVTDFFNRFDIAIVRGPQMVLLWQESGIFFMFDPKERDGMARKWTRQLSSGLGEVKPNGCACVSWYQNIEDLAETYISTVNAKHRQDAYRLVKVIVYEDVPKEIDLKAWIALDMERWRIIGKTSICAKCTDKNRTYIAICTAIAPAIMRRVKPEEQWNKETVDEILATGIDLYQQSIKTEDDAEKKENEDPAKFEFKDIKKYFNSLENQVRLLIAEGFAKGKLIGDVTDETNVGLATGLKKFFEIFSDGILTVRDRHLGIWYTNKFYYMFHPYEKFYGRNDMCICKNENPELYGYACVTRYKDLLSLTKNLLYILNIEENLDFSIANIDIRVGGNKDDRPPLYNYSEFTEKGAILRPFKNDYHEGHESFVTRADKQTLANVVTALGLANINRSSKWQKEDIVDILKIGDRMYCKVQSKQNECGIKDFKYDWPQVEIIIGSNKYKVTKTDVTAVFKVEEVEADVTPKKGADEEEEAPAVEEPPKEGEETRREEKTSEDIKKILTEWDKQEVAYAVMDCSFFKVAIWKQDNLYFIFDPKASDENGYPSARRIKKGTDIADKKKPKKEEPAEGDADKAGEGDKGAGGDKPAEADKAAKKKGEEEKISDQNYDDIPNEGSAYAAWFSTLDAFIEHLLSKVPPAYYQDQFTLSKVTFQNVMLSSNAAIENRFSYHQMPDGGPLILRATTSQNDPNFPNRGLQEASNCIVALVFALISIAEKWNSTIMDVILKYGDRLYSKSYNLLKEADPQKACFTPKLAVQNIAPSFNIYKMKFNQKFTSKVFGGLSLDFKEMRKTIGKLQTIEANVGAILRIKDRMNGLWKSGTAFYVFDPFPTDPNGYVARTGFASNVKCTSANLTMDHLTKKFSCLPGTNVFEIFLLEITHNIPSGLPTSGIITTGKEVQPSATMFVPANNGFRSLTGRLPIHSIPIILLCLATIIHGQLHYVELWTSNVFEQILFLSEYLLGKTKHEIDKLNNTIKVDIEPLIQNLTIDHIFVHVAVQNTQQGPITPHAELSSLPLRSALDIFFRENNNAIITIDGKNFALWRDKNTYYLFEDHNKDKKGLVMASASYSDFYNYMTKDVKDITNSYNRYEMKKVNVITIPIKDVCQPKKLTEFGDSINEDTLCTKITKMPTAQCWDDCFYWDNIMQHTMPTKLGRIKKCKRFTPVYFNMDVLCGKTPLKKHELYRDKPKYQASIRAAILVAAGMVSLKKPSSWSPKTIDDIMKSGIMLYKNTVAAYGKERVQITDFEKIFYMMNQRLYVVANCAAKVFLVRENLFKNFINDVSKEFRTIYLEAKKESPDDDILYLLLIFDEGSVYIFCPYLPETECRWKIKQTPCLIKLQSMNDMIKQIITIVEGFEEVVGVGPITTIIK